MAGGMIIYVLVFIQSGVLFEVRAYRTQSGVQARANVLLVEHGGCLEDWYDEESYPPLDEYLGQYGGSLTQINGKHYYVKMHDRLEIYEMTLQA